MSSGNNVVTTNPQTACLLNINYSYSLPGLNVADLLKLFLTNVLTGTFKMKSMSSYTPLQWWQNRLSWNKLSSPSPIIHCKQKLAIGKSFGMCCHLQQIGTGACFHPNDYSINVFNDQLIELDHCMRAFFCSIV